MDDLKLIKKYYGEDMMHLCKELFPTLLETKGLLFKLLSDNFAYSKLLYDDIIDQSMEEEFKDYIYSFVDVENNNKIVTNKTPFELMEDVGYTLYECKTEEDIQKFRKYYDKLGKKYELYGKNGIPKHVGEELCTFNGDRLNSCYVFFAVKKNVDEIKREERPNKDDDYSKSVISIQFRRGERNNVSIKSRYNHTVNNPDYTFRNDLDNINSGLTKSFEKYYDLNISSENDYDFELNNYVMDIDGKFYKYNYEINNVYYGPNNVIIDNFDPVSNYDPAKTLVLDYFIFDFEHKTISCYDDNIVDTFPYAFKKIDKMEIHKLNDSKDKELLIYHDGVVSKIIFDENSRMIALEYNGDMKEITHFLDYNRYLWVIKLQNAEAIGNYFLCDNSFSIRFVEFPNVKKIGTNCLPSCISLVSFEAPKAIEIGKNFASDVISLKKLDLSSIETLGEDSLEKLLSPIDEIKISDKYKDMFTGGKKL